jgi:hypothetical protein
MWKIEESFLPFLDMCRQILSDQPLFFLLNGYASGYSAIAYKNNLDELTKKYGGSVEMGELTIEESLNKRLFVLSLQTIHGWLGDNMFQSPFLGMAFFLTAFVFSALVCGSAVVGYPLVLLFEKNARRAVSVICWSAAWLGLFLVLALMFAVGTSL